MPPEKSHLRPVYLHWKRFERWPASVAACLLLDVDPDGRIGHAIARCWFSDEHRVRSAREDLPESARRLFDEVRKIGGYINVALRAGSLNHSVYPADFDALEPRTFLLWARDKGMEAPRPLAELIANQSSRKQLSAEIERLTLRIAELEEAAATRAGSAETLRIRTLQKLVLAMAKARYGWTPGARNSATGEKTGSIPADVVEQLGESRRIDPDTIRGVLDEANGAFPGRAD